MLRKGIVNKLCLVTTLIFVRVYCEKNCWTSFDAKQHFDLMDELDERYAEVRKSYQETVGGADFDKKMLVVMLKNRGIAERTLHAAHGNQKVIPAGINLGGYCMLKMPESLLFFHRMKLRNNTVFRIVDLESDFANMQLKARILLNDLHLFGSYDFANTNVPGRLTYMPTFGQVELLLKNVRYNIEGRYRLLKNKLNLELLVSEVEMDDILIMHRNVNSTLTVKLQEKNIDVFIDRLKIDLDKWLKDYFNDYLMYFVVAENPEFEKYNQEKTKELNNYTDEVIDIVIRRINDVKADAVQLPSFTIVDHDIEKEIRLREGVLRGLDSIYRRSIATGAKENKLRKIDAVVGFSNLKLTYRYDAILKSGLPPVTGLLILSADDLSAHMSLSLVKDPESADINFKFLEQAKPESLTVEGPANRMISNFKYLLERHIVAIMTNTLVHNIHMLSTLDRCVPVLPPYKDPSGGNDIDIIHEDSLENSSEDTTIVPQSKDPHDNTVVDGDVEDNSQSVTSNSIKPDSIELRENNNNANSTENNKENTSHLTSKESAKDGNTLNDNIPTNTSILSIAKFRKNKYKLLRKGKSQIIRLRRN